MPGRAKYRGFRGGGGLFSARSFPSLQSLNPSLMRMLVQSSNNALASSTWDNYKRALGKLEDCARSTGRRMSFPMTETMVLVFIAYLLRKGLKTSSVDKMLSAVRMLHMTHGHPVPVLRPPAVQNILVGRRHFDEERDRYRSTRLPVTIDVLRLIWVKLKLSGMDKFHQGLMWAVSAVAFWGCFRVGELLPKEARKIDPLNSLLRRDVWIVKKRVGDKLTR